MVKCSFVLILLSFSLFSKNKEQIAVLPFSSQGLEEKELFTIEESLRKELSESGKYDVMERSVLEKKLKSEGINNLNSCDELACALVFGEFLALNYVIQGRLSKIENTYTFSIRFIDTKKEIIIDDFSEFFTGNFESLLKNIVPKLSRKIQRIRIRKWKVEKTGNKKFEEVQVKRKKPAVEEQKIPSVSTSTTLAPNFELEKETGESALSVSPPDEIPDKKKEQKNRRGEEAEKPIAPATEELKVSSVPPVSTSTTLVRKIELEKLKEATEKAIPEEEQKLEETEKKSLDYSILDSVNEDKIDSVESPTLLTSNVSEDAKTISDPEEIEEDIIKDPILIQQEYDNDSINAEEKDVVAFTSEIPSDDIPFTKSIGERNNELVSEEKRKVEPSASSIVESPDKKSKKKRRISRRRDRKRKIDQNDIAVSTSPVNPEYLQKDGKKNLYIDDGSETDNFKDDKSGSPSLVQDSEKVSEKSVQGKEDSYKPDDTDKTKIADIENEDPMNINDLKEEGSNKKRKVAIITSGISAGIGAAVAVPVFIYLFSKKDEKEPSTFSLTVEWP